MTPQHGLNRTTIALAVSLAVTLAAIALRASGTGEHGRAATGAVSASRNPGASRAVADAAERTLALTAKARFRLDRAQAFGGARAPVFGQGSFDFRSGAGQELIDLPEAARQELGNERAILFPAIVYLQPKGMTSAVLPAGKAWVSATIVGGESVSTNFPQFVGQVEGVNPVLALSELASGTVAAQPLGEELVNRAPTERYRVSVDLTRALAAQRGAAAPAIGQAIQQQLTSARSGVITIDVWVDRRGRLVEYRAPFPGTGDGSALVELRSFGTPVQVRAPEPSRVIDIASLTPSGERENSGGGDSDGG